MRRAVVIFTYVVHLVAIASTWPTLSPENSTELADLEPAVNQSSDSLASLAKIGKGIRSFFISENSTELADLEPAVNQSSDSLASLAKIGKGIRSFFIPEDSAELAALEPAVNQSSDSLASLAKIGKGIHSFLPSIAQSLSGIGTVIQQMLQEYTSGSCEYKDVWYTSGNSIDEEGYRDRYYSRPDRRRTCWDGRWHIKDLEWTPTAELLFDFSEMIVNPNDEIQLDCGVNGDFKDCVWMKGTDLFQIEDVYKGVYSGMGRPVGKTTDNQCGIVVDQATIDVSGIWICKIDVQGRSLVGSKNVVIQ